jgi:hypothetical protein
LERIVLRALAKDREHRFRSVTAMAQELAPFEVYAGASNPIVSTTASLQRSSSRTAFSTTHAVVGPRARWTWLAATGFVVLGSGATWAWLRIRAVDSAPAAATVPAFEKGPGDRLVAPPKSSQSVEAPLAPMSSAPAPALPSSSASSKSQIFPAKPRRTIAPKRDESAAAHLPNGNAMMPPSVSSAKSSRTPANTGPTDDDLL